MPNKSINTIRHVRLQKVDASKTISKVDVSGHADEEMISRPFVEQFGFTSHPPKGARGIAFMSDGYAEKAVILGLDLEVYKPERLEGETVIYDYFGNKIHLKDGQIDIVAAGDLNLNVSGNVTINCTQANIVAAESCTVDAPDITLNGDVSINGNTSLNGNVGSSGGGFSIGGDGGAAVARVGDQVQVGDQVGTIISGSSIATST